MAELIIEEEKTNKYISSNRNDLLKIIAMVTMFIDHLGHMDIVTDPFWNTVCRTIGRIAFPIFAYQVALGYTRTSNLPRYVKRLFAFAVISHFPYIIFDSRFLIHPLHFNVIFMLLFGIFSIMCFEKGKELWHSKKIMSIGFFILMICLVLFPQVSALLMNTPVHNPSVTPLITIGTVDFFVQYDFMFSYGSYGVLMVLFFHLFKGKPIHIVIGYLLLSTFGVWFSMASSIYRNGFNWFGHQFGYFESYFAFKEFKIFADNRDSLAKLDGFFFQSRSLLTLPFIILLERFYVKVKLNKFIGYWFYPLHMFLIFVVALAIAQTR